MKNGTTGKRRITFTLRAEEGQTVSVAGTFNNWDTSKHKMKFKDGVYTVTALIPKGHHEYKFVVNDVWCVDPECKHWTPNEVGSLNSVLNID